MATACPGCGERSSTRLSTPSSGYDGPQLAGLYAAGYSTRQIAGLTGLPRRRVALLLAQEGVQIAARGKGRARRSPSLHPMFEEVRRLYVEGGLSSTTIGAKLGLPDRTVRDLLVRSGIELRHRGGFDRTDRMPLSRAEVAALYVHATLPAEEAARQLGISHQTLLRAAHSFGLPVRDVPGAPALGDDTPVVLLDALYGDRRVRASLERHGIPIVARPGPIHERFPAPCVVRDDALRELYESCGLSLFHIELVTGHAAATVRHRLERAGVPLRPRGGRSPFRRRLRGSQR